VFILPGYDVVLTAAFSPAPPDIYTVSLAAGLTGGGITPEPASGPAGTAVTVTAAAGSGYVYQPGSLAWRKAGEEGDWTAVENNGFTLPAYHVEIRALFDPVDPGIFDSDELADVDPEEPAIVDPQGSIAVSTVEQLAAIGRATAYPADGFYVLKENLTLEGWVPLGSGETPFAGTFRGNGKTITINSFNEGVLRLPVRQRSFIGLFGHIDGGTVEDLGVTLNMAAEQKVWANENRPGNSQTQYAGAVAAYAERAVFKNITLAGALYLNKTDREDLVLGGLAGFLEAGTVSSVVSTLNIRGETTLDSGNQYVWAGGLVGAGSILSVSDCRVEGSVIALSDWGWVFAGGVAGELRDVSAGIVGSVSPIGELKLSEHIRERDYSEITRVAVTGDVSITIGITESYAVHTASGFAGGIVGSMGTAGDNTGEPSLISQSYFTGKITGKNPAEESSCHIYAGGIAGDFKTFPEYNAPIRIEDCYSLGEISTDALKGSHFAGGIVGELQHAEIRNSYAAGKVNAYILKDYSYPHVGGIAGIVRKRSIATSTVIPKIEGCVALNPELRWGVKTLDGIPAGRITNVDPGDLPVYVPAEITLSKNFAYSGMTINKTCIDEGHDKPDGRSVPDAKPPKNAYTNLGWNFGSVWTIGAAGYPVLQWQH
jgi:hypothetical protein